MLSIISVINNEQRANEYLIRALNRQNTRHELLIIDNRSNIYKNAAQAYNLAASKANGDYLVFIHQDVFFHKNQWLKEIENYMSTIPDAGLAGIAGMKKPAYVNQLEMWLRYFSIVKIHNGQTWFSTYGRGNLLTGKDQHQWPGRLVSEPVPVQTVDELMLVLPAKIFDTFKFDEKTCDSWHLYGVDLSLTLSKKRLKTYVLPPQAVHASEGKIDPLYIETLQKLIQKHKNETIINTTCGLYPTKRELLDLFWGPQQKLASTLAEKGTKIIFDSLSMLWTF